MKKSKPKKTFHHSPSQNGILNLNRDQLVLRLIDHDPSLESLNFDMELPDLELSASHARSLLSSLPSTMDEIRRRTSPVSLFSLRASLFALIDQEFLTSDEADQLAPLARILGLGQIEEALRLWFLRVHASTHLSSSTSRPQMTRLERGLAVLFHSTQGQHIFESLTGEERVLLSGPWVRPMMRLAHQELFPRHALLALYRSTQNKHQALLLDQYERCRKRVGASPFTVYSLLFEELDLIGLERLFGHLAASDELALLRSKIGECSIAVQQAYDQAIRSVSEVS